MSRRLRRAYLSSVLSISLVLLLVAISSLLLVNAGNVSGYFKESMKISVVFNQDVQQRQVEAYMDRLQQRDYVREVELVTREQGIREMGELLGEDFLSVFDTAPIPLSLNLSLKADYVTVEGVQSVIKELRSSSLVEDAVWQRSLVDKLNSNLRTISLVLGVFVLLLLFISFVLIGNTVRLNVFNRRFSIHTMRLVGASRSFICRPFIAEAVFQGVISAQIAIIMLLAALSVVKQEFVQLFTVFRMEQLLTVMGITLCSGVVICLIVTLNVTNRMISLKKEELYY